MPGEIQGAFTGEKEIATIIQNGEHGIFATTDRAEIDIKNASPVASKDEVQKGAAHIICTVDGENAKEYSIEIIRNLPEKIEEMAVVILKDAIEKISNDEKILLEALYFIAVSRTGLRISDLKMLFEIRKEKGLFPKKLDKKHKVGQFIDGNYAKHRFLL